MAEESQALELDISRDSVHNRAFVSFGFEGMSNSFSCFASVPASASRFREARFLGTRLQRSKFKKHSRLRLRLQADSEKPNSSTQTSEEANSKELLRSLKTR
ncbi:hypothetical protein RA955_01030 [Geobacillus proteiniphilus]|uniref:Uncharacterized protein n=1 Tax=Geobacillus proteiniphilus TaxID=860353 RepID=A0ABY9MFJ3_9BACL|nr:MULTISPECIES: hypothetical protein [Geobacillus]OPX03422.1 hypothetical protein B1A75_07980 [Geobacillus sp. LEMMY01]WMJ16759.1 hypothetical protein RA955_01030 [Geobacillus proteiniphilus]